MNTEIDIKCDRCGKIVHGVIIVPASNMPKITGGFYDVTEGIWQQFAKEGEQNVCDRCIWEDPEFIKLYPVNRKIPQ